MTNSQTLLRLADGARRHAEEASEHLQLAIRHAATAERTTLRAEVLLHVHEAAACALRAERQALVAAELVGQAKASGAVTELGRRLILAVENLGFAADRFAREADQEVARARRAADTFDARMHERRAQAERDALRARREVAA